MYVNIQLEDSLQHMKESYDLKINELEKCLLQEKVSLYTKVFKCLIVTIHI